MRTDPVAEHLNRTGGLVFDGEGETVQFFQQSSHTLLEHQQQRKVYIKALNQTQPSSDLSPSVDRWN